MVKANQLALERPERSENNDSRSLIQRNCRHELNLVTLMSSIGDKARKRTGEMSPPLESERAASFREIAMIRSAVTGNSWA